MPWNLRAEKARLRQVQASLEQSKMAQEQGERELMLSIRRSCRDVSLRRQQLDAVTRAAESAEHEMGTDAIALRARLGECARLTRG